tara:strand:- start:123 stop:350 length:228 start_codon:yes stop_codon:yes gene_type:complete
MRKKCDEICEESHKCDISCEDNTIPGLGTFWCNLNTNRRYVTESVKQTFCNNELYKSKCMLSCDQICEHDEHDAS